MRVQNETNAAQGAARGKALPGAVTIERLEHAITTVADMMVKHDIPQLIVTIRYLEAERDKLRQETAAMDYAKEILRKRAQQRKQHHGSDVH
jgi:hypothetical protein